MIKESDFDGNEAEIVAVVTEEETSYMEEDIEIKLSSAYAMGANLNVGIKVGYATVGDKVGELRLCAVFEE